MFGRGMLLLMAALVAVPSRRGNSDDRTGARAAVLTARIVDDLTGRPIEGARLLVDWRARFDRRVGAWSKPDGSLTATLDPFERGAVRWSVTHPSHARSVGRADTDEMRDGQRVDLGDVRLERGVALSGRVVTAGRRRPVAGAELRLLTPRASDGFLGPAVAESMAKTDSTGAFRLSERVGLHHGELLTLFAVAEDGIGWRSLRLDAERPERDDVVVELARNASLAAQVVDESGRPVEKATVVALPRFAPLGAEEGDLDWRDFSEDHALASRFIATTRADGTAELHGLPVRERGVTYELLAHRFGLEGARSIRLDLPRPDPLPIRFTLARRKEWRLTGTVLDSRGHPIERAEVEYRAHLERTGSDGRFECRFDRPPERGDPGLYGDMVRVSAPGHGRTWRRLPTELEGGVALDFVLPDAAPITGRVVDERGAPVADLLLQLTRAGDGETIAGCGEMIAMSESSGRFDFAATWAGDWWLDVVPFVFRHDHGIPARLRVTAGEEVTVRVHRPPRGKATLVAALFADATGAEVPVEQAMLEPERGKSWRTRFRPSFESNRVVQEELLPGRYVLRVVTRDGAHGAAHFAVEEGDSTVSMVVTSHAPGTIEGRVVPWPPPERVAGDRSPLARSAGDRSPLARLDPALGRGGRVEPARSSGADIRWSVDGAAELDDTGGFRFHGVAPLVPLDLTITGDGWIASRRLTLDAGESRKIELQPVASGELAIVGAEGLADGVLRVDLVDPAELAGDDDATLPPWSNGTPWRRVLSEYVGDARALSPAMRSTPLAPGRFRWQASYWPLSHDGATDAPRVLAGEFTLAAGERVAIDLSSLR